MLSYAQRMVLEAEDRKKQQYRKNGILDMRAKCRYKDRCLMVTGNEARGSREDPLSCRRCGKV